MAEQRYPQQQPGTHRFIPFNSGQTDNSAPGRYLPIPNQCPQFPYANVPGHGFPPNVQDSIGYSHPARIGERFEGGPSQRIPKFNVFMEKLDSIERNMNSLTRSVKKLIKYGKEMKSRNLELQNLKICRCNNRPPLDQVELSVSKKETQRNKMRYRSQSGNSVKSKSTSLSKSPNESWSLRSGSRSHSSRNQELRNLKKFRLPVSKKEMQQDKMRSRSQSFNSVQSKSSSHSKGRSLRSRSRSLGLSSSTSFFSTTSSDEQSSDNEVSTKVQLLKRKRKE